MNWKRLKEDTWLDANRYRIILAVWGFSTVLNLILSMLGLYQMYENGGVGMVLIEAFAVLFVTMVGPWMLYAVLWVQLVNPMCPGRFLMLAIKFFRGFFLVTIVMGILAAFVGGSSTMVIGVAAYLGAVHFKEKNSVRIACKM